MEKEPYLISNTEDEEHVTDWSDRLQQFFQCTTAELSAEFLKNGKNQPGAICVDAAIFQELYRFIKQIEGQYPDQFQMVLLTLIVEGKEKDSVPDPSCLAHLQDAIKTSIRNVDIFTISEPGRYDILLTNASKDYIPVIVERIREKFYSKTNDPDIRLKTFIQTQ
ncbi:MAG: hypothetical protein SOT18_07015 [Eubacterium sp.]|nr:hypothetical protein [Eubacterium sp.]